MESYLTQWTGRTPSITVSEPGQNMAAAGLPCLIAETQNGIAWFHQRGSLAVSPFIVNLGPPIAASSISLPITPLRSGRLPVTSV